MWNRLNSSSAGGITAGTTMAGADPASIGAVTPGAAVLAGAAASVGMAGTADLAGSGAADVPVDIRGSVTPVGDLVAEDPAAATRAAATRAEVTHAEVTQVVVIRAAVATHITRH
jgi:hypothetical protein